MPNIAYNNPIDLDSSWGFAVFGNGGMNTNWPNMANPTTGLHLRRSRRLARGNQRVLRQARSLSILMQAFIALGYARRFGAFSVGISPVIAIQRIKVQGISAFAGISSDPDEFYQ